MLKLYFNSFNFLFFLKYTQNVKRTYRSSCKSYQWNFALKFMPGEIDGIKDILELGQGFSWSAQALEIIRFQKGIGKNWTLDKYLKIMIIKNILDSLQKALNLH
jgi:hypothetical protein